MKSSTGVGSKREKPHCLRDTCLGTRSSSLALVSVEYVGGENGPLLRVPRLRQLNSGLSCPAFHGKKGNGTRGGDGVSWETVGGRRGSGGER